MTSRLPYRRAMFHALVERLKEPKRFIQAVVGPRQSGKTTLVHQALENLDRPFHFASADDPLVKDSPWIESQWEVGRIRAGENRKGGILVLDEIQKITGWSSVVKALWDDDSRRRVPLHVVILGSSPLLIGRGLSESLAGRFEIIRTPHWSFVEMRKAFGWLVDEYIYYGGYPGSAPLVRDEERWRRYILDSLIETTISRDILLLTRIDKPALLRRMFQLGCEYSGRILSYQKMCGQLQDAGNTTTLAHYLELLAGAGMLCGLAKHSSQKVRQRASSPKLQVLNTGLLSAQESLSFKDVRSSGEDWGRLVESAVGAHLINSSTGSSIDVQYWRERNHEVDYVLQQGKTLVAIEVKSGRKREATTGLDVFGKAHKVKKKLIVGTGGIPLDEFLARPAAAWIED